MPPKASTSAQAEVPEDEIDEEFPEDQEPEPAASTRKPRVLKKPNERKKFKGTGVSLSLTPCSPKFRI
jgi:hypothetical protein